MHLHSVCVSQLSLILMYPWSCASKQRCILFHPLVVRCHRYRQLHVKYHQIFLKETNFKNSPLFFLEDAKPINKSHLLLPHRLPKYLRIMLWTFSLHEKVKIHFTHICSYVPLVCLLRAFAPNRKQLLRPSNIEASFSLLCGGGFWGPA